MPFWFILLSLLLFVSRLYSLSHHPSPPLSPLSLFLTVSCEKNKVGYCFLSSLLYHVLAFMWLNKFLCCWLFFFFSLSLICNPLFLLVSLSFHFCPNLFSLFLSLYFFLLSLSPSLPGELSVSCQSLHQSSTGAEPGLSETPHLKDRDG